MANTPLPSREQAQQAYSYMVDQVHVPAFFEKLSANGIEPRNEAEAQQLMQLGAVLADAEANGRIKRAADRSNPFLDQVLQRVSPQQRPDVNAVVRQNADYLIHNNELAKTAALVYAHAASGGELTDTEQPEESQEQED